MYIQECQKYAKEKGFDSVEFTLIGNGHVLSCKWLDAYFGMLTIDREDFKGSFMTVEQIEEIMPEHTCLVIEE